jgi:hypothetical protein
LILELCTRHTVEATTNSRINRGEAAINRGEAAINRGEAAINRGEVAINRGEVAAIDWGGGLLEGAG